jgi:mono/diheme cytochrome c family protein
MMLILALFAFSGTVMAADGALLYASKCQFCHGANGAGAAMGPKLTSNDFIKGDATAIKNIISSGIAMDAKKYPNFMMGMPKVALSDAELDAIVAYLKGL